MPQSGTNFGSKMLASAMRGFKNISAAYKEAVDMEYRFFFYGDAMLIL